MFSPGQCKEVTGKFEKKMEMEKYVELLSELEERAGSEPAAIAILQEMGKDRRNGAARRNGNGEATEKQLAYLKDLGVEVSPGISKLEASRLIDEANGAK